VFRDMLNHWGKDCSIEGYCVRDRGIVEAPVAGKP